MAEGDIGAPVDTLIWNALGVLQPRAVHVSGNVFAFVYEEYDDRGMVATVSIDTEGNIAAAIIDSLLYESTTMEWPDIVHVSGNVFAIVHSGVDTDGFLRTVTINTDGSIDDTEIDSFEFETVNCGRPKIFHIAGATFGITYGKNNTGKLVTVEIAANGTITDPVLDTLVYDATGCSFSNPIKIDNNIFAIFYNRTNGPGRVVTLTISDAGAITDTAIDSLEIDAGVVLTSDVCGVGTGIYAYAYVKSDYKNYMASVDIDAAGNIGSVKDTLNFEPTESYITRVEILRISDTIVCVAYTGPGSDGFMKTVEIDSAGNITDPVLSTLEFDTVKGGDPSLIHIAGDIYAVFYYGETDYGTIKTPTILTPTAGRIQYLPIMGIG